MSHKDDGERETTSDLRPSSASADDQPPKQTGDDANLKAIASDGENQLHHTDHHLYIGPELVVHVAAFASIANSDVLNICLAVGPIPSHAIRKTYLQNNAHYLENSLRCLLQTPMGEANTKKCRDDYRAWMAVNSDWKGRCTNEMIECLQRREEVDASGTRDANSPPTARSFGSIHPYDPFNSPAIAIELGLNEILRFHVEARNVDINAHFPSLFGVEQRHLLAVAMDGNNVEAFRFLTSHDNADMMRRANADTSLFQYAWAAAKKINYVDCFIINTLIEHQSFDANAILPGNGHGNNLRPLQKCLHELEDLMEGNTTTGNLNSAPFLFALSILLMLLERGSDPGFREHGVTAPPRMAYDLYMGEKHRSRILPRGVRRVRSSLWKKVTKLLLDPTHGLARWKELKRDTGSFFSFGRRQKPLAATARCTTE